MVGLWGRYEIGYGWAIGRVRDRVWLGNREGTG